MTALLLLIGALVAFDVIVARYGAESRPGFDERPERRPTGLL